MLFVRMWQKLEYVRKSARFIWQNKRDCERKGRGKFDGKGLIFFLAVLFMSMTLSQAGAQQATVQVVPVSINVSARLKERNKKKRQPYSTPESKNCERSSKKQTINSLALTRPPEF